jgi:hypothetical protein
MYSAAIQGATAGQPDSVLSTLSEPTLRQLLRILWDYGYTVRAGHGTYRINTSPIDTLDGPARITSIVIRSAE